MDVRYLKNEYVAEMEYPEGHTGDHVLDFDNFSPNEMESMLFGPLETRGSFHFGSELGDLDDVPILNHVTIYLEYLKDHSPLKLTPKGNLPLSFCNYLIGRGLLGDKYFQDPKQPLRSEEDSYYLNFMKMLLYKMGLSSKRYNRFSLSGKGKKFLKMEMSERYRILFTYIIAGFNWAYFDRYPESWIVQGGSIFSIFLFQKYGDVKRPPEFYTDRFRIAFPNLLRDFQGHRYGDPVPIYESCYRTRVIERFLHRLGLIDIEYKDENKWEMISVKKRPLIDKVLTWKRDVFDFDREGYIREKEERLRNIEREKLDRKLSSKYAKKILSRMDPGKTKGDKIYTLDVHLVQGPQPGEFDEKEISRRIQIRGDQKLDDLHRVIFKAFDRWEEHFYEFLLGEGPFDRSVVYGLPFGIDTEYDDSTGDVRETNIDSLGLTVDRAFGYRFDFGDEWLHQINVIAIEEGNSGGRYPKVIDRVGVSPSQYPQIDE